MAKRSELLIINWVLSNPLSCKLKLKKKEKAEAYELGAE